MSQVNEPGNVDRGVSRLPQFLGRLGVASLSAMQATNDVQDSLERIANAYGRSDVRVFVLPTLVLVEDPATLPPSTEFFPATGGDLRLDQAGSVEKLVDRGTIGTLAPEDLLAELDQIEQRGPRFGAGISILGNILLTLGFGMMLNPSLAALPIYLLLGAAVGVVVRLGSSIRMLSLILPVFTAFVMTLITVEFVQPHVEEDVLRLLAPALMSFLPGLQLTIAAVELTNGQVMAGASRMLYGVARLGLLGFGVFAAMTVLHRSDYDGGTIEPLGWWAPWVGTALVGVGYYYFSGAPRGSMPWILLVLVAAYAAQSVGNLLVGPQLSGLVGAAVIAPVSYALSSWAKAPASVVLMTCGYWLLVPGALGFIGVGELETAASGANGSVVATLTSLLSIATGMVIGAGVSHGASSVRRRLRRISLRRI